MGDCRKRLQKVAKHCWSLAPGAEPSPECGEATADDKFNVSCLLEWPTPGLRFGIFWLQQTFPDEKGFSTLCRKLHVANPPAPSPYTPRWPPSIVEMFSVKRFDAFAASSSSSSAPEKGSADSAKLDALNERILKKRKLAVGADAPSPAAQSSSSALPKVSTSAASSSVASAAAPTKPALNIHPSRLNAAPLLRQSVNKARTGPKEKTKAKQRYLKAKKDRRKARQRAAPKKQKNDLQQAQAIADNSAVPHLPEEEKLQRLEASRSKGAAAAARKAAASSASGRLPAQTRTQTRTRIRIRSTIQTQGPGAMNRSRPLHPSLRK